MSVNATAMLAFIDRYLSDNGYAPTVRDIRDGMQISSTSVVDYHLYWLERRGLILRKPRIARSIRLTHIGASEAKRPAP